MQLVRFRKPLSFGDVSISAYALVSHHEGKDGFMPHLLLDGNRAPRLPEGTRFNRHGDLWIGHSDGPLVVALRHAAKDIKLVDAGGDGRPALYATEQAHGSGSAAIRIIVRESDIAEGGKSRDVLLELNGPHSVTADDMNKLEGWTFPVAPVVLLTKTNRTPRPALVFVSSLESVLTAPASGMPDEASGGDGAPTNQSTATSGDAGEKPKPKRVKTNI